MTDRAKLGRQAVSTRLRRTAKEEQRLADEMFLEECLKEIDEGQDITIVAEPEAARRMRKILKEKRRGGVRVVAGDPEKACASLPAADDEKEDR